MLPSGLMANFNEGTESDSVLEILRRFAGMGFVVKGASWGKPWGYGRRQGGQGPPGAVAGIRQNRESRGKSLQGSYRNAS